MKTPLRVSLLLLMILPFLQSTGASAQTDSSQEIGIHPSGTYQGGDVDSVDLMSGNLMVRIPLFSLPQKGNLSLSFSAVMNNPQYVEGQVCDTNPVDGSPECFPILHQDFNSSPMVGLPGINILPDQAMTLASTTHYGIYNSQALVYSFGDASGTSHELGWDNGNSGILRANDGSGYSIGFSPVSNSANSGDALTTPLMDPAGNSYSFPHSSIPFIDYPTTLQTSITDVFNNQISFIPATGTVPGWGSITDTIGRAIPGPFSAGATGTVGNCPVIANQPAATANYPWPVPGPSGATVTYSICTTTVSYSTSFNDHVVDYLQYEGIFSYEDTENYSQVIQSIILPNGTYWGFRYDDAGDLSVFDGFPTGYGTPPNLPEGYESLTGLIYPTGGSVAYGYTTLQTCSSGKNRAVASRIVNDGAGTLSPWSYSYNVRFATIATTAPSVTVTDPNLNDTYHLFNNTLPVSLDDSSCTQAESDVIRYVGSRPSSGTGGTTIQTSHTNYLSVKDPQSYIGYFSGTANLLPKDVVTTLDDGTVTTTTYTYPTLFTDYERGIGTLTNYVPILFNQPSTILVEDSTGYSVGSLNKYKWQDTPSFLASNFMNQVVSTCTMPGTPTACSVSGTPQPAAYEEMDYDSHGTLTLAKQWIDKSGAYATTTISPTASGKPSTVQDARSNTTSYTYDPSGIFPITVAQPSTANGATHTDQYTYDPNTGNLASHTDQNNNTTTYFYDVVGRLKQVSYPDSSSATYCYWDLGTTSTIAGCAAGASVNSVTTTHTASSSIVSSQSFDGLGRKKQAALLSDPSGTTTTTTAYNAMGQVASVTNPQRSAPAQTINGTTYFSQYDALGRLKSEIETDGATLTWTYGGRSTTSTDEAGHSWTKTTDVNGHIVNVVEPGGLDTDYHYNTLGNLTSIVQNGDVALGDTPRYRSFSYDSLSRLLSSSNPETGFICYGHESTATGCAADGYDLNGNLLYKTDARGVLTSISYDEINRPTFKTYSDQTLPAGYGYDNFSEVNLPVSPSTTNGVGRISHISNTFNTAANYSYDTMGRLIGAAYCIPTDCSYTIRASAAYDGAGNMTDLTYPDGHHIQQTFDGAGRFDGSGLIDINGTPWKQAYVYNTLYNPDGTPVVSAFGNGVFQNTQENVRLQTAVSVIGSSTGLLGARQFLIHAHCLTPACALSGAGDNGNIFGILDIIKFTQSTFYSYDSLNRVTGFYPIMGANRFYTNDAFGNNSPLDANYHPIYTFSNTTNQLANLPCAVGVTAFDSNGNQVCSTDQYGGTSVNVFDAENRLTSINALGSSTPYASYVYGADGARVEKSITGSGASTEYINFNGQTLAELDQAGNWTDYIYKNGSMVAKVAPTQVLHHYGVCTNCTGGAGNWKVAGLVSSLGANGQNYVIQSGDTLVFQQKLSHAQAGLYLISDQGSNSLGTLFDQNGDNVNSDSNTDGNWHARVVDLSAWQGQTLSQNGNIGVSVDSNTPTGVYWDSQIADIALVSLDGSVHTMFNNQILAGVPLGTGQALFANLITTEAAPATHFFFADHLGSAQMEFASGGWPVSASQFDPFGAELDSDLSSSHYKFTGKERDTESGLDYFGARYYASSMGRFSSPDPSGLVFADPGNPQTLNLYAYVSNNPLSNVDPNGLSWFTQPCTSDGPATGAEDSATSLGTRVKNFFGNLFCGGGSSSSPSDPDVGGGGNSQTGSGRQFNTTPQMAINTLQNSASTLSKMKLKHKACLADLAALGTNARAWQAQAGDASFVNGVGSSVPFSAVVPGSNPALRPGTIGDQFAGHPGTTALAVLGGNTVYINPSLIDPRDYFGNLGLVGHETIHNVTGKVDQDIQADLGITVSGNSTINITQKIIQDCF